MSTNDDDLSSDGNEFISPDGTVTPELEDDIENTKSKEYSTSKVSIPTFKKILVADDGKFNRIEHFPMPFLYPILQELKYSFYVFWKMLKNLKMSL